MKKSKGSDAKASQLITNMMPSYVTGAANYSRDCVN
jgi:hypothetical protein